MAVRLGMRLRKGDIRFDYLIGIDVEAEVDLDGSYWDSKRRSLDSSGFKGSTSW